MRTLAKNLGDFIRKLRVENQWTQEQLAAKVCVDRTSVNKWENGKSIPDIDNLENLCKVFHVTIEEMFAGTKMNTHNKKAVQMTFLDFLKSQYQYQHKLKVLIVILLIFILLFLFLFGLNYFFQNYRSVRVYSFWGNSENYSISDGLIMVSKGRLYFKIGNIKPEVDTISIYYDDELVYKGDPNQTITDIYGYQSFLDYDEFIRSQDKLYIMINDEKIFLQFYLIYTNDNLFFSKENVIGTQNSEQKNVVIPEKIANTFQCDDLVCYYSNQNVLCNYDIDTHIFNVSYENVYYSYGEKYFSYRSNEKDNTFFEIKDSELFCYSGDCSNADTILNNFEINFANKFLR